MITQVSICSLHPTPDRGTEYSNSFLLRTAFRNDRDAKHEGYILVWARVRSTRVPNFIHHEGRGCNAYKDKRDRSFKILRYFRNSVPTGTELQFSVPLASVER